jgi:hypothetical protein
MQSFKLARIGTCNVLSNPLEMKILIRNIWMQLPVTNLKVKFAIFVLTMQIAQSAY